MYWRVGIQQANSTGFPLPILFEALASAMREEEKKEDELVDITKRKLGHDLGGYCKIPSFALEWS